MRRKLNTISFFLVVVFLCACAQVPTSEISPETGIPSPSLSPQATFPDPKPISTATSKADLPDPQGEGCSGNTGNTSPESRIALGPFEDIPESSAEGERLVLEATLYYRDCRPISGATLELWQTDADGMYGPGHGTDNMQCCYFQGTVQTDEHGNFEITTVYPGYYKGEANPPPAHIHVSIRLPGSEPGARAIDTEIVFAGDPHMPANAGPPIFTIVALEETQDAGEVTWVGVADIVLNIDPPEEK